MPPNDPARTVPVVDPNRCQARGPCVAVCPHGVFELGVLSEAARSELSWMGRLRAWSQGWEQSVVARPQDCAGCGKCEIACPERAITLVNAG